MTQTFHKPSWNIDPNKKIAYINARVMDAETGLDEACGTDGGVLTIGREIAEVGAGIFKDGTPEGAEVVDCGGHLLCPGLIDIQVHFREPGQEWKETIETGSKSCVVGGITTAACMPNTKPVLDNLTTLGYHQKRAKDTGYMNVRTYAAISEGMKGESLTEMALLVEQGAVGFTDDGLPAMNAQVMRQALHMGAALNVPIAQHAEDLNLSGGGCITEGKVSAQLGVKGIPNVSESVIVARDIALSELTGGHYHVLHISVKEAVEMVREAKAKGIKVTAEAAPHHFTITEEAVLEHGADAKMNPPLRSEEDRLALIEGLKDGTIDAIATDHAPHEPEVKRVPVEEGAFGIVGVETMLPLSLALYHKGELPLMQLIGAMTYKPADIIHVPGGRLQKGHVADLVLIDLDTEWTIDPQEFSSKSKNSPFVNFPTKGRAVRTVVGGECVYELN